MRKIKLSIMAALVTGLTYGQSITEVTGKTFFEHHSSSINNGADFGVGANGSQSGYDFVNHQYYNSFNPNTFGPWQNGEEANIDMVEHNGPYGNMGDFGFTSGTSTIWNPDIKGNSTTVWMPAPSSFDYDNLSDPSTIASAMASGTPGTAISAVSENEVYLGQIRDSSLYVAIKVYNVNNYNGSGPPSGQLDVKFDFDYKYGSVSSVGLEEKPMSSLSIYPNPASNDLNINLKQGKIQSVSIMDLTGQVILTSKENRHKVSVDLSGFTHGIYLAKITTDTGSEITRKVVVN